MKLQLRRRRALAALMAACASVALPAIAQSYPDHTLRLVVPFPAGGPTDIVARPFAQLLSGALGQPVLVENRGGAGGSIGADVVAKAPADGYTLLMGTVGTNAINGALYRHLSYDPVKDFTPIALVASSPVVLVVNAKSSAHSVQEFIAAAKAQPGRIAFGSAGNGTPGHLTGEMFSTAAGVKLQHVPYRGSAPAITDLLGNQVPSMFDPLQSVIAHVRNGRLRALAVSGTERSAALPEVPTFAEAGVAGLESRAWWAVFAPANLPPDIEKRLREESDRVIRSEAFRTPLTAIGVQTNTEGAPLAQFQKTEVVRWQKAVRDSGAVNE